MRTLTHTFALLYWNINYALEAHLWGNCGWQGDDGEDGLNGVHGEQVTFCLSGFMLSFIVTCNKTEVEGLYRTTLEFIFPEYSI